MATVTEGQRVKDRRRDYRRRIAVDVAFALADLNASWGDYDRALEHLAAADEIAGGTLTSRFADVRASWVEQAAATARPD
jgi:hypothetical protein